MFGIRVRFAHIDTPGRYDSEKWQCFAFPSNSQEAHPVSTILIHLAGVLQLLVASANIFAFSKFKYREHLEKVPRVMRQVFLVQNAYIMLVQLGFALLCFCFAHELTSGQGVGRAIAAFLAPFWGSRVLLQLVYYDRELRRQNRMFDILFLLADGYLAVVFAAAALLGGAAEGAR